MKATPTILTVRPLNKLGECLRAKSRTAKDAEFILANLDKLIRKTRDCAPTPRGKLGKNYRLHVQPEGDRMHDNSAERRLEAALYKKFHRDAIPGSRPEVLLNGVAEIASFQVPLYSVQEKMGWGSIDALGVDNTGYPVVVELKLDKKRIEPLLRAVVEALAYMIALRTNWDDFCPFWSRHMDPNRGSLGKLTAVVLAPSGYWAKVRNDVHHQSALQPITKLIEELVKRDYVIRLASIDATDSLNAGKKEWRITGSAQEEKI